MSRPRNRHWLVKLALVKALLHFLRLHQRTPIRVILVPDQYGNRCAQSGSLPHTGYELKRICLDAHPSATTMPLSTAPQVLFHIIEIQDKASRQSLQHTHLAGPMGFTCSSQAEMGHALSSLQDRRPKAPLNSSPAFNYTAIASLQELLPCSENSSLAPMQESDQLCACVNIHDFDIAPGRRHDIPNLPIFIYRTVHLEGHDRSVVDYVYGPVSYTHLRAHETVLDLVCRLLLEKKKKKK